VPILIAAPFLTAPTVDNKKLSRINKYTPAVTKVGAAIAAGSQEENGSCALVVEAVKMSKAISKSEISLVLALM